MYKKNFLKRIVENIYPHQENMHEDICNELPCFPYMSYNLTYQCIYIHIPKTAGTSILSSLNYHAGRHHCGYIYYKMSDSSKFNSYFKFSVVRNPFDRLVSSYVYLKNGGNMKEDAFFIDLFRDQYHDFDSFVLGFMDKEVIHEIRILNPQYLFIYDFKKTIQVDYVVRFENIDRDFKEVCRKIHLKHKVLDVLNKSRRDNFKDYYKNGNVIKKVVDLYGKDFELFNYSLVP